ncbi:MAG TPA: alpha/beta family hydrolase [Burkholderiales bacterium]|nr:alpha/beta family hydrolase [Burkholderiales bacterium]
MLRLAETLAPLGDVVRFNFPYRDQGSGRPDPMPVLKRTIEEAVRRARIDLQPKQIFLGGRSMGGRAASMLAAEGFACDGLLLFAYPLHPAGQPEKLRDAHLAKIRVPVLCFNGTRDALCTRELMEAAVSGLANWTVCWLEAADHSFRVLKSSGRTEAQVYEAIGAVSSRWLSERA